MSKTVIVGPSCSGKSTYAWGQREDTDLVVDYDRIAQALGCAEAHGASGDILKASFEARMAAINVALASENPSWIIHSTPTAEHIEEYMDAGCVFVVLDPGLEECLERCENDERPEGTAERIREWYDDPPEFPDDAVVTVITPESENKMTEHRNMWGRIGAITNRADGAKATVYIFDEIGYWGTDAQSFSQRITDLEVDSLDVHINSPGGDAFAGVAIMNALRDHKANVHVIVDGIAASAASIIAMGGDTITMNLGSQMMIHDASTYAYGDAKYLRKQADALDTISNSLAEVYASRAGGTAEEWRTTMQEEQWYSATEAVDAGLADEVDTSTKAKPAAQDKIHNHLPAWGNGPTIPAEREQNGGTMPEMKALYARLGLTETATEDEVLEAFDAALTDVKAPVVPDGVTQIEDTVLDQLREDAAAGREAREQQIHARRAAKVDAAIKDGKIAPARRDHWLNAITADEDGITATLDSLASGLIPTEAKGTAIETEDGITDAEYLAVYPTQEEK